MIRNNFVYELDNLFDMQHLALLADRMVNERVAGRANHHRMVRDDPYMVSIQQKYPLLSDVYNVYPLPPHIEIPLHIDRDRSCAFNIPIRNTENTHTIFYDPIGELELEYDERRIYDLVRSPVQEVFRHTLMRPLLINNTMPHKVTNDNDTVRLTISWSLRKGVTQQQAIRCFNEPVY